HADVHPYPALVLRRPVGTRRPDAPALVSRPAQARPRARRRHLLIPGKAIQRLEPADVAVAPVDEADLAGGTESAAGRNQVPGIEGDAEHHLSAAGQVDAAAHPEPEQPEVGAATARRSDLRRMKLLGGEPRDSARRE